MKCIEQERDEVMQFDGARDVFDNQVVLKVLGAPIRSQVLDIH